MLMLLIFELKKIAVKKAAIISFLCMILCMVALSTFVITETNEFTNTASVQKKPAPEVEGYLTPERLAAVLTHYHEIMSNPDNFVDTPGGIRSLKNEIYEAELRRYASILIMMKEVFSSFSPSSSDIFALLDTTPDDAKMFYEARNRLLEITLGGDEIVGLCTEVEKEFYLRMNREIETPFYYTPIGGWYLLIKGGFYILLLIVMFIACVCLSPVFANEYQTRTDSIILASKYGKNKVIAAKIIASWIFITSIFIIAILLYGTIILSHFGISGWNVPIQINVIYSTYAFTMFEVFLLGIAICYSAVLSVMAIVLLFSSVLRNPFHTIIIGVLLIYIPWFIPKDTNVGLINYLVVLLPIHATDILTYILPYKPYTLLGNIITLPAMFILVALATVSVCLPITYFRFKRHQV